MEYLSEGDYLIAKANGISRRNANQRFYDYGMSREDAITKPLSNRNKGIWSKYKKVAEANGISNQAFNYRIVKGMDPEEASTKPISKRGSRSNE